MDNKSKSYLENYIEVDKTLEEKIESHCKRYHLDGEICAWYKDLDDFFADWCNIGYSKEEAQLILYGDIGEFLILGNNGIIRFTM